MRTAIFHNPPRAVEVADRTEAVVQPTRPVASRATSTLAAAVLGFFVIALDAVVVNVALPSIHRDLGGGIPGLQWVVDGYTLLFAALLLWAGALTDRIGARRAFTPVWASSWPPRSSAVWRLVWARWWWPGSCRVRPRR